MLYRILYVLAWILLTPIYFLRVVGRKNIPPKNEGGCVVICNHKSNWDPVILGMSVKGRPISYLAKEELQRKKIAKFFLQRLNIVPIARGKGDLKAMKTAISLIKEGKTLGVFPEGTRSKDGELLPFSQGAALIALRSNAIVLPVYIKGGYKPFSPIKVFIGESIDLKASVGEKIDSNAINKATQLMFDEVKKLGDAAWQK